jgi:lactoylglutathione lyase
MKIEHIALWVTDLERMKDFYTRYFGVSAGEKYVNPKKQFTSYFLYFGADQTRLEIMNWPDMKSNPGKRGFLEGLAHFAISVGSKQVVDTLTEQLRADGYTIESEPRTTGDGYYESVVLDPEGNYVEISA